MERKAFLEAHPSLHSKLEGLGFELEKVRVVPRGGALGELAPVHGEYLQAVYSAFPSPGREAFDDREVNAISERLKGALAEHKDAVLDHQLADDRSTASLRLLLRVKREG